MLLSWQVTEGQRGKRLDQVLRREHGLSRRQVTRLKCDPEAVRINGQAAPVVARLSVGDVIRVNLEEHLAPLPGEAIPLDILYEDEDILVLNKPSGLVCHPTKGYKGGTLANALSFYWAQRGEFRPARLVTRLDKDTSGLVLVAKSAWSHHRLSKIEMKKEYIALVRGVPKIPRGEISLPIGRDPVNPKLRGPDPQGKPALTIYTVEAMGENIALVRLFPATGRTHQLRIHMAGIGCALVDDFMYGTMEGIVGRTALHASSLSFPHPRSGKSLHFSASLPEDIKQAIGKYL